MSNDSSSSKDNAKTNVFLNYSYHDWLISPKFFGNSEEARGISTLLRRRECFVVGIDRLTYTQFKKKLKKLESEKLDWGGIHSALYTQFYFL